jgi:general stress protein CsbA
MMTFDMLVFTPWIALIAGVAILLVPRLLNYIVAIYLILIGVIGLVARFWAAAMATTQRAAILSRRKGVSLLCVLFYPLRRIFPLASPDHMVAGRIFFSKTLFCQLARLLQV